MRAHPDPKAFYSDVKLLATCPAGKEEKAEVELLDAILPWDSSVEVLKTGFPGVLLVRTSLGPEEALRATRSLYMAYVKSVVPIYAVVEAELGAVVEACINLAKRIGLGGGSSFAVRCRRRGRALGSSVEVEEAVGGAVRRATGARVDLGNPDVVLRVEALGDVVLLGLDKSLSPTSLPRRVR